jgi:predicted Zn-dependent protease
MDFRAAMRLLRFATFLLPKCSAYGDDQGYARPMIPMGCLGRLLIAGVIAAVALFQYFNTHSEVNSFTGRTQRLDLDPQSEIQMGLTSEPQMLSQYGGESADAQARAYVTKIGNKIVASTSAGQTPYRFQFHLLADRETVNAFALPGGQVFITEALFRRLNSEDQIAGVLGHEIGHVVGRHSSEQIAQSNLFDGLTRAAILAVNNGQGSGYDAARIAQMASQLVNLRYSRADESEADMLGVHFLAESGYRPEAMIEVMEVLKKLADGSPKQAQIFQTHPDPGNRIERIRAEIDKMRSGAK